MTLQPFKVPFLENLSVSLQTMTIALQILPVPNTCTRQHYLSRLFTLHMLRPGRDMNMKGVQSAFDGKET